MNQETNVFQCNTNQIRKWVFNTSYLIKAPRCNLKTLKNLLYLSFWSHSHAFGGVVTFWRRSHPPTVSFFFFFFFFFPPAISLRAVLPEKKIKKQPNFQDCLKLVFNQLKTGLEPVLEQFLANLKSQNCLVAKPTFWPLSYIKSSQIC